MTNKAIDNTAFATFDSLKNFKKKLGSTALATTLVATSLFTAVTETGTAYAAEVNLTNNSISALAQLNETSDTIIMAANATASEISLDSGDIRIASGAKASTGNMVMTVTDNATPVGTFDVDGDLTAATGNLTVLTDDNTVKVLIGGAVTENSVAIKFQLQDTAILEFDSAGTSISKNIDGIIDGVADAEGTLSLAGVTEIDEIVGGANHLKNITVATGKSGDFNAGVHSVGLTTVGTGSVNFDAAVGIDTIVNNGTITLNATLDNEAGDGDASLTLTGTGSVLNIYGSANIGHDAVYKAAADGDGTINIADSADDAPAVNTTAGGDIGENGKKIGIINIGTATKAGNLTTIDDDAIFAAAINITGGNVDAEDSVLDLHENIGDSNDLVAMTLTDLAGDAELDVGTVSLIFGTIDGTAGVAGSGSSIIDVNAALTVSGNIGGTNAVELMEVGATTTLDGAVNTITSINFTADSILDISGTVDQTVTSTIVNGTLENGEVNVTNALGTVTFTGAIGTATKRVKEVDLADNTDVVFQSAIFANTLDINTAAADDVITFEVGGSIVGDLGATDDSVEIAGGTIILGTAITSGTTVMDIQTVDADTNGLLIAAAVAVQPSAHFNSGTVTLFDGVDDTSYFTDAAEVAFIQITNNAITQYTVSNSAALKGDTFITASNKAAATTATELGVSTNEATAVQQLLTAAIASDSALAVTLNNSLTGVNSGVLSTTTDLSKQAAPQTDAIGGSSIATRAMTGTVQGIVSNRMASLRSGDAFVTGMSAGNGMSANSGFIQAFGSEGEQKNTSTSGATVYGFDTETSGVAIGFDGMTEDGSTIGLSASYSTTDVDGKGTGKSKNSIDSYTVSAYADKATENGYIEGSLTYGINDNTASRIVNTAGLNRTYNANYDSQQISLKVGGGVPNEVMDGTFVTPFVSATATNINSDAYTETSAVSNDALRLKVEQDDINSLVGSVGVKAHMVTDNGTPMISLAVNNEFGDGQISSQNTYQGGGTKFKTTTEVEELSATLGLGFSFGNDVTSLNINYEANVNDDEYVNQYGSIKIVAKF
jgi:uncharacterized protein with beta-barrel porin domain